MLSERQERILKLVVGRYLDSGRPVGSRAIADREGIEWSASTVRAELASLEDEGFLTHPHTSAGRVPTDAGYRFFADRLIDTAEKLPASPGRPGGLTARREVDAALRDATEALSEATDLAALATAPPASAARIRRVEVLPLQPRVVMVIVIASTGAVSKHAYTFEEPVDPGLVEWASSYLNERIGGLTLGARMIRGRLDDPELGDTERAFLARVSEHLVGLDDEADEVYLDGTAHLLSERRVEELPGVEGLVRVLEQRVVLLSLLRSTLEERSVVAWIGGENPEPELRGASVVAANYGLGYRNLGSVCVIGPMRMDYARAISSVRDTAGELSRFFATVYEG